MSISVFTVHERAAQMAQQFISMSSMRVKQHHTKNPQTTVLQNLLDAAFNNAHKYHGVNQNTVAYYVLQEFIKSQNDTLRALNMPNFYNLESSTMLNWGTGQVPDTKKSYNILLSALDHHDEAHTLLLNQSVWIQQHYADVSGFSFRTRDVVEYAVRTAVLYTLHTALVELDEDVPIAWNIPLLTHSITTQLSHISLPDLVQIDPKADQCATDLQRANR